MKAAALPLPIAFETRHLRWGTCLLVVLAVHVAAGLAFTLWKTIERVRQPPPALMLELGGSPGGGGKGDLAALHQPAALAKARIHPEVTHRPVAKRMAQKPTPSVQKAIAKTIVSPSSLDAVNLAAKTENATSAPAQGSGSGGGSGATGGTCSDGSGSGGFGGGEGTGYGGGKPTWLGLLLAHLEHFKRYPLEAEQGRQQGVAYLQFTMDRSGRVLRSSLQQSSGYQALDDETIAMV